MRILNKSLSYSNVFFKWLCKRCQFKIQTQAWGESNINYLIFRRAFWDANFLLILLHYESRKKLITNNFLIYEPVFDLWTMRNKNINFYGNQEAIKDFKCQNKS